MNLSTLLKTVRIKNNLTQEQLANKLLVSHQTISKWENGINIPSIDNLLLLSDLYNLSLDELIRGGAYFRKPFIVGKKVSASKILLLVSVWLFISLFFTGFGYQPLWLFISIFILGILVVLPTTLENYWIIGNNGIVVNQYPNSSLKKVGTILKKTTNSNFGEQLIPYEQIDSFEIIYIKKVRLSPFDVNPDYFFVYLTSKKGVIYKLAISSEFMKYLPQAASYIEKRGIMIIDNHHLIQAIVNEEHLFEYMEKLTL